MVILRCLLTVCLAALNGVALAADDVPRQNAGKAEQKIEYDQEGFTKLHRAAIGGRLEEVSTLIDEGVDVNAPQLTFQGTPLQYAAARGHKEVVELLVSSGAKVDAADTAGRTPLMWAADKGQTEIVKVLLKNKADINAETKTGWTAFRYAAQTGKKELIQLFIGKVQVDQLDAEGFSALHRAASGGDATFAQALIDAGVDVNVRQKTYQGTPLQYAANQGHTDVIKILLKAKAEIDATDKFGRTPLMWAAMAGKKEVVEVLLSAGANVNAATESGWTALRYAQDKDYEDIAKLLARKIEREADSKPASAEKADE